MQPCFLFVVLATVGIFRCMRNSLPLNPKTQSMIPIDRSDINHMSYFLDSVTSCSLLSGYFNILRAMNLLAYKDSQER